MPDSAVDLVVLRHHEPADRAAITAPLIAFNQSRAPEAGRAPLAILINSGADGATTGGLWGQIVYDWLWVELLVVPVFLRGVGIGREIMVGREIMAKTEAVARAEGCAGIWLATFAFQAEGFYRKCGFAPFGAIDDHPRGNSCVFLQKRLDCWIDGSAFDRVPA